MRASRTQIVITPLHLIRVRVVNKMKKKITISQRKLVYGKTKRFTVRAVFARNQFTDLCGGGRRTATRRRALPLVRARRSFCQSDRNKTPFLGYDGRRIGIPQSSECCFRSAGKHETRVTNETQYPQYCGVGRVRKKNK